MSCNLLHIQLKNKNYINFNKNKKKILEIFKSSIGNDNINSNYNYISNKNILSSKFIFKLKGDPYPGYINQYFENIFYY